VIGSLAAELSSRNAPKLLIQKRNERVHGAPIASSDSLEKIGDFLAHWLLSIDRCPPPKSSEVMVWIRWILFLAPLFGSIQLPATQTFALDAATPRRHTSLPT
jgi:hypothetical protein